MENIWIRDGKILIQDPGWKTLDPGWKNSDPGSGINIPYRNAGQDDISVPRKITWMLLKINCC